MKELITKALCSIKLQNNKSKVAIMCNFGDCRKRDVTEKCFVILASIDEIPLPFQQEQINELYLIWRNQSETSLKQIVVKQWMEPLCPLFILQIKEEFASEIIKITKL